MPRRRDEYDDDVEDEDQDDAIDEDDDDYGTSRGGSKRRRSDFIDDAAEEDEDEEEEEEEDDDDEDYGGGGGGGRRRGAKAAKKASGANFFELEADVDSDAEEDDEDDAEDDFIVNERDDHDAEDARRMRRPLLTRDDEQEDVEALERKIQERYARNRSEYDDDDDQTEVEQQALLPSVRDPKLWMVKCAIGHEREVAVCLMQKCIDKAAEMQIRSAIALDHLKNYIYIEADKEAHVREACKGMRNIFTGSKILLVPIKEMTDVLSVESKAIDISRDTWVRMKIGTYKGDLAKVVDVDNVRQRVTVKLIPRIDLQALANKLGDLKNLKGWVEKVEESTVHIKPNATDLPETLAVSERELCKYFEPGNHVKVVSGAQEGVTGMVITVEGHLVNIVSDTTKEALRVFSDNVVESSEVTSGITKIGDFELHDLVQLDNSNFGVIIRVDSEAFQVLKGVADRAEVQLVRLRDIKYKIDRKISAQDRYKNTVSTKDVVKVIDGPCKGRQGPVEHIYRGILFIYDRHHLEHAGFICTKSQSCILVGGSRANGDRNGNPLASRVAQLRTPRFSNSPGRSPGRGGPPLSAGARHRGGGRGRDSLAGTSIKIRLGPWKGYKGRSQMRVVTVDRTHISDIVNATTTPYRDTHRYGSGSETPMHPSRTPLHPYMTPMRDSGATPIHDGMRTPMRDRAWNPYTPMSPSRDSWEDGNPGSWGSSPQYQPGSPRSRAYEAPTPGSGWANTPGGSYSEAGTPRDNTPAYANAPSPYLPSTPGGQPPMTPSSAFLPGTPGGQPMTPGGAGLDIMSPVLVYFSMLRNYDNELNVFNRTDISKYNVDDNGGLCIVGGDGPWFLPNILVNVRRSGDDAALGVIREVLLDGAFDRTHISDIMNATTTPYCAGHMYGSGSETPMHPSRTSLHPYMTPMRDSGVTPIHDSMRTPMRDRAWNPYTPMSPSRDSWEDGNPGSWGSNPQYQVRTLH
nr:putative transcription elongation factor SPT5 homolog 1 [Tanacetum cinerariifolium]